MRLFRRSFGMALVVIGTTGCVQTLEAQSFPATFRAQWDTPPPGDNVTQYLFSQDGGPQVTVPATVNTACGCIEKSFTLTTAGSHTVSVVAQNLALSSDPTSLQSSAPLVVTFVVNGPPNGAQGGRIRK